MRDFSIAWPPRNEQTEIAAFLDHETGKIDVLIEEQRRLVELLKEKRQAVISHAVTKGLDPNVPMKDSGVELLGEVPVHWEVKRLRYLAELNPPKSEIRVLPGEIRVSFAPMEAVGEDGSLVLEQTRALQDVIDGYTYVRDGDVVVAKITPCCENGKAAMMRGLTNGVGLGTTELTVLRPGGPVATSAYLFRVVTSEPFHWLGESHMYGAGGQKRVPDDYVRDFSIAWPPRNEQTEIAAFLDHETCKIDALVEEAEKAITLMTERRSALISAAVTGKIDVRGWSADAEPQEPEPELAMVAESSAGYASQGDSA